ncbi:MAG TPA: glycosyltransferase family 2 protein [Planctomycetota bacterium]|nr:glycosyltransferase family 2 protein [Planctomycetota bacterium]
MSATLSPSTMAPSQPAKPKAPRLSIVIPTYNEEGNIPLLDAAIHGALAKAAISDYEIVHVDDGSKDRSADEVKAEIAKDRRVRLIRLKQNSGETAATEAGIRNAKGDVVIVMDCDLQNDPEDIPKLLAKIGEFDCVCGYREKRGEGDNLVRIVSSRIANNVRNWALGDGIRDSGCTFRAFKREALKDVKFFRGMHRFLPTLLQMQGFKVTEVPVKNHERKFGVSKYGVWNRVFAASADLLAVKWMRMRTIKWEVGEEA